MRTALATRLALAAGLSLLLAFIVGAGAQAAVKKPAGPAKALRDVVTQTVKLPRASVPSPRRARLLGLARHARRVAASSPCSAVRDMTSYRRVLKTTRVKARVRAALRRRGLAALAQANAASTSASRSLLSSSRTRRCGGGGTPSTLSEAKATVMKSDENGITLRVRLPQLQFVSEQGGGKSFTKLVAPGTETPGNPGQPGIPVSSEVIAVPDGAQLEVKATKTESFTIGGVEVFPIQPDPVDQAGGQSPAPNFLSGPFARQPFVKEGRTSGPVPAAPAFGRALGQARDLNIAGLHFPSAQYNPRTDTLKVFTRLDVRVTFSGGSKAFTGALGSPWETAQNRIAGGLLNAGAIRKFVRPIVYQPCGEELLVITNPSTLASANTYATARRAAGFLTRVFQTGTPTVGTTTASIQAFIRSHVNSPFCIRPSYVTIIGDDELVPTFTTGPGGIPSDNPYSTKNDTDELPDLAVGRVLGNDVAQIDAQLAKIIHYETSPPTGPMLSRALIAAQFQDTDGEGQVNDGQENRTFIQFAETARNGLVGRGVAVDRIYTDNPTTNPKKFNDGTDLPAALKKPTFAWDGDGADVSAAWNQGRFMVVHRDHGWSDGWGDPFFTTTEVDALTNDNENLPVVLSINCASAQ
ncbi:MAG: C25 family cysteine peptidase, partial [Solirubrobacteraceae bacterium]